MLMAAPGKDSRGSPVSPTARIGKAMGSGRKKNSRGIGLDLRHDHQVRLLVVIENSDYGDLIYLTRVGNRSA